MNTRDPRIRSEAIPDVQSSADTRRLAIDKVGIKAIRHPVKIQEQGGGVQHTIAMFNMYVRLPQHFKGTHMSRFVAILNAHEREITVKSFQVMLKEMVEKLEAQDGRIEMTFPYFIDKAAPVSGVRSLMDYEVTFAGEIRKGKPVFSMKVLVPVTSLCPCSKEISDYGAHNQRSHVTVTAATNEFVRSRRSSRWSRSRPRANCTACSSAPTRSSSPSAPTIIPSSSRTWCGTSRLC